MLPEYIFLITYGLGKVNILPAQITVTPAAGQSKVYGKTDPTFIYINNGDLTTTDFNGKLGRVAGKNVNTYTYTLGNLSAGTNNSISLSAVAPLAKFSVTKASLTIKADNKVIFQGGSLPTLTATITRLKNGDNPTVSFLPLNPPYTGDPGEYTIIPFLQLFSNSGNYYYGTPQSSYRRLVDFR